MATNVTSAIHRSGYGYKWHQCQPLDRVWLQMSPVPTGGQDMAIHDTSTNHWTGYGYKCHQYQQLVSECPLQHYSQPLVWVSALAARVQTVDLRDSWLPGTLVPTVGVRTKDWEVFERQQCLTYPLRSERDVVTMSMTSWNVWVGWLATTTFAHWLPLCGLLPIPLNLRLKTYFSVNSCFLVLIVTHGTSFLKIDVSQHSTLKQHP